MGDQREQLHFSSEPSIVPDMVFSIASGRYNLVELLGRGGMGEVWKCRDTELSVDRAVKLLSPRLVNDARQRACFLREARLMAKLHHPRILRIHDAGDDGEHSFLVMPLVAGGSLADRLKKTGVLGVRETVQLCARVAEALAHAHEMGVIHRDVKPHNILMKEPLNPLLCDFGIARLVSPANGAYLTSGAILGTRLYMSPEQRLGQPLSRASDLYSLSMTLLQLVTNASAETLLSAEGRSILLGHLPKQLGELLRVMLSETPSDRLWGGTEYASLLSDCLRTCPVEPLTHTFDGGPTLAPTRTNETASAESAPTGTVSLLFGSLGSESDDRWPAAAAALQELAASHGGYEVKSTAKTWFVSFERATSAVKCGLAVLARFAHEDLPFQMGIHTGFPSIVPDPTTGKSDYVGRPVNRAARVMQAAHGGQLLVSGVTRSIIASAVKDAVWTDLGNYRLRGLHRLESLHQVVPSQLSEREYPPPKSERERATNLPEVSDRFIGREVELASLKQRVHESHRLITLLGSGGTGKTRLATEFARKELKRFSGGAWFCGLSDVLTVDSFCHVVARVFDVPLTHSDPIQQLGWMLARKGSILLILDNMEQIYEEAHSVISRWLTMAPDLVLLVTSQVAIGHHNEAVIYLDPLAVEDAQSTAVSLFVARAQQVRPEFNLTESNAADCLALVRQLDGLPLAIELAASRIRLFLPKQLLTRLSEHLGMLRSRGEERPSRHKTLMSAVEWSFQLLSPIEQSCLAQCSVFRGGWSLEAAEEIVVLPAGSEVWILDVLEALMDRSLLTRRETEAGEMRFGLLNHIQEFCAETLKGRNEESATQQRYVRYFSKFGTEESIAALNVSGGTERRQILATELPNLVKAVESALAEDLIDEAALSCLAASHVFEFSGPLNKAISLTKRVLNHDVGPHARWRLQLGLASQLHSKGMAEEVFHHLELVLELCRSQGIIQGECQALLGFGVVYLRTRQLQKAEQALNRSLQLCETLRDSGGKGRTLAALGACQMYAYEFEKSQILFEQALRLAERSGDERTAEQILQNLGTLASRMGNKSRARDYTESALAKSRAVGDRRTEGMILGNLAVLERQEHRLHQAEKYYEDALRTHRAVGNIRNEGTVLGHLGYVAFICGRYTLALSFYERALEIHRAVNNHFDEAIEMTRMAQTLHFCDEYSKAASLCEVSIKTSLTLGNRRAVAGARAQFGESLLALGQHQAARIQLERVIESDLPVFQGNARVALAVLHAHHGEYAEARTFMEQGLNQLRGTFRWDYGIALCKQGALEILAGAPDTARAALIESIAVASEMGSDEDSHLGLRIAALKARLT